MARIWTVGVVVLALVIVAVVVFAPDDGGDSSGSAPNATTATTGPSPAPSVPVTTVPAATVVRLEAKPGSGFAATTVLLLSSAGTWTIADSGTGGVGCGTAPQPVLVDLGLFCIGAGGSTR